MCKNKTVLFSSGKIREALELKTGHTSKSRELQRKMKVEEEKSCKRGLRMTSSSVVSGFGWVGTVLIICEEPHI